MDRAGQPVRAAVPVCGRGSGTCPPLRAGSVPRSLRVCEVLAWGWSESSWSSCFFVSGQQRVWPSLCFHSVWVAGSRLENLRTDRNGRPWRGICGLPASLGVWGGSDLKPSIAPGSGQVLQGRGGLLTPQRCSRDGLLCGLVCCRGADGGLFGVQIIEHQPGRSSEIQGD